MRQSVDRPLIKTLLWSVEGKRRNLVRWLDRIAPYWLKSRQAAGVLDRTHEHGCYFVVQVLKAYRDVVDVPPRQLVVAWPWQRTDCAHASCYAPLSDIYTYAPALFCNARVGFYAAFALSSWWAER
jgi:hypothetical protein